MKPFMGLAAAVAMLLALAVGPALATGDQAAQKVGNAWLKLVDKGDYAKAYQQTAPFFQQKISLDKWNEITAKLAKQLGKAGQRKLLMVKKLENLAGAPKGKYMALIYYPDFKPLPLAIELVILMQAKGKWLVGGYFVK